MTNQTLSRSLADAQSDVTRLEAEKANYMQAMGDAATSGNIEEMQRLIARYFPMTIESLTAHTRVLGLQMEIGLLLVQAGLVSEIGNRTNIERQLERCQVILQALTEARDRTEAFHVEADTRMRDTLEYIKTLTDRGIEQSAQIRELLQTGNNQQN